MRRLAIAVFGALAFSATPAHAATFQVNTTADSAVCNAVACSLRGALVAAEANGVLVDDFINVPAGTYAVPELNLSTAKRGADRDRRRRSEQHLHPAGRGDARVQPHRLFRPDAARRDGARRPPRRGRRQHRVASASTHAGPGPRHDGQAAEWRWHRGLGSGHLVITTSVIDANNATGANRWRALPPGVTIHATVVTDSTIALNTAGWRGNRAVQPAVPTFRGVTIATTERKASGGRWFPVD